MPTGTGKYGVGNAFHSCMYVHMSFGENKSMLRFLHISKVSMARLPLPLPGYGWTLNIVI